MEEKLPRTPSPSDPVDVIFSEIITKANTNLRILTGIVDLYEHNSNYAGERGAGDVYKGRWKDLGLGETCPKINVRVLACRKKVIVMMFVSLK
jgi:hypothetical protein